MRPVEELCEVFRERGLRITPQRRLIFEALRDDMDHPTVEDIYRRVQEVMPDVSLATVYHTLEHLEEMGEVLQLDLGEGKSRYDPSTGTHHHLVCLGCRRVLDIMRDIGGLELSPKERSGYQIIRCDVVFYGHCPDCQG
jgi:Fur family peroxide stress response transcriptional regulator